MNIVVAGPKVQIYGEDVKTYKKLPAQSYQFVLIKILVFSLLLLRTYAQMKIKFMEIIKSK